MNPSMFSARADLGLAWSVKDSFLQYIRGMRDGDIRWTDGAAVTNDGEFFFPLSDLHSDSDKDVLGFGGDVTFTAHHGLLSVPIRQPRIVVREGFADLSIRVGAVDQKIATIELPPAIQDGDVTMWLRCRVTLTGAGSDLFGGTYPEGEALAPMTIRFPARTDNRDIFSHNLEAR